MASIIEERNMYGSPCDDLPKTIKRGLGPEYLYPFIVIFFATILRKILRYDLNYLFDIFSFLLLFFPIDIIIFLFHIQLY